MLLPLQSHERTEKRFINDNRHFLTPGANRWNLRLKLRKQSLRARASPIRTPMCSGKWHRSMLRIREHLELLLHCFSGKVNCLQFEGAPVEGSASWMEQHIVDAANEITGVFDLRIRRLLRTKSV